MQTATERMNFHQPEKSLPNRPHPAEFYSKELLESVQPKQEESKVERKPKHKTKSK